MTRNLPAWLELRDGAIKVIPHCAAVVQRIFELSIAGYGLASIVGKLTEEGTRGWLLRLRGGEGAEQESGAQIACLLRESPPTKRSLPVNDGRPPGLPPPRASCD